VSKEGRKKKNKTQEQNQKERQRKTVKSRVITD